MNQLILTLVSEKSVTSKNETRLRELEAAINAAQCSSNGGGGGCSPRNAKWYEFFCPTYGQN